MFQQLDSNNTGEIDIDNWLTGIAAMQFDSSLLRLGVATMMQPESKKRRHGRPAPAALQPFEIARPDVVYDFKCGEGKYGVVYAARWKGARVAAKELIVRQFDSDAEHEQAFHDFYAEAEMLSRLRHPNMASFLGVVMDNTPTIITEFVQRGTLADVMSDGDGVSLKEVLQMFRQLASVLKYLHTLEPTIIHRDLKPGAFCIVVDDGCAGLVCC